jgi:arabinose-5-phosphate isomerase
VTGVVDTHGELIGVVTDNDLRAACSGRRGARLSARDLMTDIRRRSANALAARARMEQHSITSLLSSPRHAPPVGVVHLHDILKAVA